MISISWYTQYIPLPGPAAPCRFLGLPLPAQTRPVKKKTSPSIVGLHPYRLFTFGLSPFGLHPIGLPMTFGLSPDYKYVWTIPIGLTKTFGLHPKETTITFANKTLFWNTLKIRFSDNPTHVLLLYSPATKKAPLEWVKELSNTDIRMLTLFFSIKWLACKSQFKTTAITYELHHSVLLLVDFLSHLPSLLRMSEISAIKKSANDRTVKVCLTTAIFSWSHYLKSHNLK